VHLDRRPDDVYSPRGTVDAEPGFAVDTVLFDLSMHALGGVSHWLGIQPQ
jgi:hypothetical protein